jgi:hypothetical protein
MERNPRTLRRGRLTVAEVGAMALSMDEQRILDEMERRLADDDPRLASRLASLGRPGLAVALRASRARMVAALLAVALVVVVSVLVYAMMPFRSGATRNPHAHVTPTPGLTRPVHSTRGASSKGSAATASGAP